jgi:hypothetical protein
MSHLSALVERFIRAIDHCDIPIAYNDAEKKLKHTVANIIEYVYFFQKNIKKEEVTELVEDLEGIKMKRE